MHISLTIACLYRGGALAILAAYDMSVNLNLSVRMYNFGGPRVGNPAFASKYNQAVPYSFRIVMEGDLVTGIPKFVRFALLRSFDG